MTFREQGLAALNAGHVATAIQHLQLAVQELPEDGPAWAGLGMAFCRAGHPAEGVQALERAVLLAPRKAPFFYNLGLGLEMLGRNAEALAAHRQALALDANHTLAAAAARRLAAVVSSGPPAAAPVHAPPPPPPPAMPPFPTANPAPPAPVPGYGWGTPYGPPVQERPSTPPSPAPSLKQETTRKELLLLGGMALGITLMVVLGFFIVTLARGPERGSGRPFATAAAPRSNSGSPRPSFPAPLFPVEQASSTGLSFPGAEIRNPEFGFSITLPSGFSEGIPRHQMVSTGRGGLARAVSYETNTSNGELFVICIACPAEVYDGMGPEAWFRQFRTSFPLQMQFQRNGTQSLRVGAYPAEESRIDTGLGLHRRHGRLRMIAARPRLFLVGYVGNAETDAEGGPFVQYLESLQITDGVSPGGVVSPIQVPRPPDIPRFTPSVPRYEPPSLPRMEPPPIPRYEPPPMPRFERPQIPRPDFPRPQFPSGFPNTPHLEQFPRRPFPGGPASGSSPDGGGPGNVPSNIPNGF